MTTTATQKLIDKRQVQQIQIRLSKENLDRTERLTFLSAQTGRAIKSTKDLTQIEAEDILFFLNNGEFDTTSWGKFDKNNKQHLTLLSRLRTAQWVVKDDKYGEVADLERLHRFLKSDKSPIKKPLRAMTPNEVSKLIFVFDQIIKGTYK
jgi:predicted DNA-binding protein